MGDTYRQGWWPFFHSWLLAPAYILLGNSYSAARSVSLVCFVGFLITLYLIGLEMSERMGHWVGLSAVVLATTSMPILAYSAMSMTEVPGLFMSALTLLFYLKALRSRRASFMFAASIFMSLTFFTQWHHGVFVISAILLMQMLNTPPIFSRASLCLLCPFTLLMVGWFVYPQHITSFINHATFQPHYYRFWSLENFGYYPKSFLQVYHSSPLVATVVVMSVLLSVRKLREAKVKVLFLNLLVGIGLLTFKLDHRHRYIITLVPIIWILGSHEFVAFVSGVAAYVKNARQRFACLLTGSLCVCLLMVPGVVRMYRTYPQSLIQYEFWSDQRQKEAYEFIAENVTGHRDLAMFSSWDYFNSLKGPTVRWQLEARRFDEEVRSREKKQKTMQYVRNLLANRNGLAFSELVGYFGSRNVNVLEYHLLSFMKALNGDAYKEYRQAHALNPFSDKIADVLRMDERITCVLGVYRNGEEDLNQYAERFFAGQSTWKEVSVRRFEDLNIVLKIYERRSGPGMPADAGASGKIEE